jgi:hypothetical protein
MVVAVEDIEAVLNGACAFAAAFYDVIDRFKRHQRFVYNVGLADLEYRTLERDPRPRTSYRMSMRSPSTIIAAYDEPRVVDRVALEKPDAEIERAVVLLEQRAQD